MKTKMVIVLLFLGFSIFTSCSIEKHVPKEFVNAVEEIRLKYAPDKRIALFNVEYTYDNNILIVNAETDNHDALEDLNSAAENLLEKNSYNLQINKLPSTGFGDSIYAIVKVSVANIRKTPKHSAELIDQSILGTELKILKRKHGWYLIQTPYSYLGWMQSSSFVRCNKNELDNWKHSKKVRVSSNYARIFSDKTHQSNPISDAVFGSMLTYISKSESWLHVSLPDGKKGYIEDKYCTIDLMKPSTNSINIDELIKTANEFLGIPYLWGGNSSKGFDCSGFSQTVYKSQGFILSRDANMQVKLGMEIKHDSTFSNVKKGDLLFFGPNEDRITHVAISLGGSEFIHSSGTVHINSFDKNHEKFNNYRYSTLRHIKRIVM